MNIINTLGNMFSLFRRAFGGYTWSIVLMAVLSFLSGLLEGIGITAIIPLLSFIGGSGQATDAISLAIAGLFRYFDVSYTFRFLLLFIVVLFIAKAVSMLVAQYVTAIITTDYERKTRERLLGFTLRAKWPFLSAQKVGHLDQLLTTDISSSAAILTYLSSAILVFANLVIYTGLVFNISPPVALLAFLAGVLIFVGFKPFLSKTRLISDKMVRRYKDIAHFSTEHIIGAKVIKSMHLESPALSRGGLLLDDMRSLGLRVSFLRNVLPAALQLVGLFFIVGLFAFLYKTAAFQFASFAVAVYALSKVFNNLQFAQTNLHAISMQIPYLESVLRYEEEATKERENEMGSEHFMFTDVIRFNDISFMYRANEPAISSVNFAIRRGEIIGLIGPSGAGKTTVMDILLRLILPSQGTITIDGKDTTLVSLKEWRSHIGYVPQDVFLVNDTIENNIKFYDPTISNEHMREAASMAHILPFIESQPKGFGTPVGERGTALSGGQRQRIALARALARNPSILILDEATSALDHESEAAIQTAVESLRGKVTVIVIAHRLSTINIADTIVVIDKGRVLESGKPKDLLGDRNSYFSKLYASTQ